MAYYDLAIVAVPTDQRTAYVAWAENMNTVLVEYGALAITDCWGDDVPDGTINSLNSAVLKEEHETVAAGWIKWPSKAVRDEGMQKLSTDPRIVGDNNHAPFDGKRMIFGGFEPFRDG